jgi:hypothetical protein
MSGTLKKKDDLMSGLWVEQFFVLDPGSRRLAYYAKEPATLTAGGGSEFRFCNYENIEERGGSSRKFRLDIHVDQSGKEKTIAVAARTQQDKIAWIQALASTDEMEFICPQCYEAFKKQQDLVGHFEEHQAEANALLLHERNDAQSPEGGDVERQFEPIQILDDYVGAPEREMRSAQLLSEMVMESEMIKEMVNTAKTREDLLDMNHHFAHMLGRLPLPLSDLEGLTLKQANKDASRERFIVNGRLVEGCNFMKELLDKVAPLDTGIKKASELPASQYVYFLTSRTIWDGDIYFVANALLVQPSPFNLLMQPVLKSDLPSIHVDIQAEMVEETLEEEKRRIEDEAAEATRTRRRRSADDVDVTKRSAKKGRQRRLKNIVFIRTFSSYALHRGDDIDSFSGDGGWIHLDASLTVRVDLENREHSRHLKLTLKAPFGGMADLASGMAGHQCQICAKAHVGQEQSKLGDAMGSMLKVKHQQVEALQEALSAKDKQVGALTEEVARLRSQHDQDLSAATARVQDSMGADGREQRASQKDSQAAMNAAIKSLMAEQAHKLAKIKEQEAEKMGEMRDRMESLTEAHETAITELVQHVETARDTERSIEMQQEIVAREAQCMALQAQVADLEGQMAQNSHTLASKEAELATTYQETRIKAEEAGRQELEAAMGRERGELRAEYESELQSRKAQLADLQVVLQAANAKCAQLEVEFAEKDKERVGAMAKLSKGMEHEHQLALEAALKAKEAEGHAERVDQEKMLAMTNERLMDAVNQLCELGMEPSRGPTKVEMAEAEAKAEADAEVEAKARAREATAAAALAFAVKRESDMEEEDYIIEAARKRTEREQGAGAEAEAKSRREERSPKRILRDAEAAAASERAKLRVEAATATAAALSPKKLFATRKDDGDDDAEDASSVTSAGSDQTDQGIKEAEKDRRFKKPMTIVGV